jgi:hypothetical protein
MRRSVSYAIRLGLGVGIVAYLLWRVGPGQVAVLVQGLDPYWLLAAVAVQLLAKVVWALRWSALLRLFSLRPPLVGLIRAVLVGLFFNNFLPTSVGGDLYRAYWVADGEVGYARSLFLVLMERVIGLITLAYVALPALVVLLLGAGLGLDGAVLWIGVVLLALCGSLLLLHPRVLPRLLGWLSERRGGRLGVPVDLLIESFAALGRPGALRWQIISASFGVQLMGIAFYYCLGRSLSLALSLGHYFVLAPLVALLTMIPISLNGIGVREGSLIVLTAALGASVEADQAVALGLLSSIVVLAVSLLGAIVYVGGRRGKGTLPA